MPTNGKPRRRKLPRWLLVPGAAGVALAAACTAVASFDASPDFAPRDVAVVLGAAVSGTAPSPVFQARIDHGIDLLAQGRVRRVMFTGGRAAGDELSEGDAAYRYATAKGAPAAKLLVERRSTTTATNITEAKALLAESGFRSVVLVSDPLHLKRAQMLAERYELDAVPSATPYTRYRSTWPRALFTLREGYFVLRLWLGID